MGNGAEFECHGICGLKHIEQNWRLANKHFFLSNHPPPFSLLLRISHPKATLPKNMKEKSDSKIQHRFTDREHADGMWETFSSYEYQRNNIDVLQTWTVQHHHNKTHIYVSVVATDLLLLLFANILGFVQDDVCVSWHGIFQRSLARMEME